MQQSLFAAIIGIMANETNDFHAIAVLIDADNTQLTKLEPVLHELSAYGRIVAKKAYGNWKKPNLAKWEDEIKRLAIKAVQQFDYVSGKNTTDIAMVIDAMDLLHNGMYDAVSLVSSDSDFTPLAVRLKESGIYVIGVGEKKTPEAFCNACDDFILIEYLNGGKEKTKKKKETEQKAQKPAEQETDSDLPDINEIHLLLRIAYDKYRDDDDFVNVSIAGTYIKRVKPEFNTFLYGFGKLSDLIKAFPYKYETKREKHAGKAAVVSYRCI